MFCIHKNIYAANIMFYERFGQMKPIHVIYSMYPNSTQFIVASNTNWLVNPNSSTNRETITICSISFLSLGLLDLVLLLLTIIITFWCWLHFKCVHSYVFYCTLSLTGLWQDSNVTIRIVSTCVYSYSLKAYRVITFKPYIVHLWFDWPRKAEDSIVWPTKRFT